MIYAFLLLVSLYALLCVLASASKFRQWKAQPSMISMFTGGVVLAQALVLKTSGFSRSWILALAALIMIAAAAWRNGALQGKVHLSHHLIRWALSLLILAGFVFL
ncbi:MAG: hypothetical protein E7319_04725 [Clostridiales bacterium]|nr:hypothetical protein [Clostridiales bacterium]